MRSEIPPQTDIPGDAVVQKHRQRSCNFNGRLKKLLWLKFVAWETCRRESRGESRELHRLMSSSDSTRNCGHGAVDSSFILSSLQSPCS